MKDKRQTPASAGAERSEDPADAGGEALGRGRPGRRSAEERTAAVLELLSGKATADQLAARFGVYPSTILGWRDEAMTGIAEAMRRGQGKSPREAELERKLWSLEKAFTNLAIKHELVERAMSQRPWLPGRFSK